MNVLNYERQILSLKDDELEKLVREWAVSQKSLYHSTHRKAGAGDLGRDVVGFYTPNKHEGIWDNYQCKQYGKTLPTSEGILEIGKILYYAYKNKFTQPKNYYFVAPRGVNRNLDHLISNPSKFKSELITSWEKNCETKIIKNSQIKMTATLKSSIEQFDFSSISVIDIDTIASDKKFRAILVDWFGGELLPPPKAITPKEIQKKEKKYIDKILDAYSDSEKKTYSTIEDLAQHEDFLHDFEIQRERFFSADTFKCFYRDNTVKNTLDTFEEEIFKGVQSTAIKKYQNAFERMCSVLEQAALIKPSGKLEIHAKIDVKQGYCHHFANDDKLKWRKTK